MMNDGSLRIWQYSFPSKKLEGWAQIILREDGFFAAVSDYGNYAYYWRSHGHDDFRKFFLRVDWHYVANKLKPETYLNQDKSFEAVKAYVKEVRRTGSYTKEDARDLWALIEKHGEDWEGFIRDSAVYRFLDEPWAYTVQEMSQDVVAFAQRIVCKRLREAIEEELGINEQTQDTA